MQFQTAVEYQCFADRWFKSCVRVTLDPVSALNSWWNSGSSFGFVLNDAIPCFWCIQSPCFASFVWSPFADLVVSKDSDICWIFDGWMKDFCGVARRYPRKSVIIAGFYPRKSVIDYCKADWFPSLTYHIINRNNHIYILYDRLKYDGD